MASPRALSLLFAMVLGVGLTGCNLQDEQHTAENNGDDDASSSDTQVSDAFDTSSNDAVDEDSGAEDTGQSGSPEITSFTVEGGTDATVDEGTEVEVSWASMNTTSCTAGGTLTSWASQGAGLASSGTFSASTTGLANGEYELTLDCDSSDGVISAPNPLIVTVENSSETVSCDSRSPVPLTRETDIVLNSDNDATSFASVFGPFPGVGNTKPIIVETDKYVALEFTTPASMSPGAEGGIDHVVLQPLPPNTATSSRAPKMWSISKCQGDFRENILDEEMGPGCVQGGRGTLSDQGSFRFGGTDFIDDDSVCALEPRTTYYLNFFYTDQDPPTTEAEHNALESTCPEPLCGNGMVPIGIPVGW